MHASAEIFRFGRFQIDFQRRVLTEDGVGLPLSSRAFDIMALLVHHRDRVVAKAEILQSVWPGTFVEENIVAVHISALRRALGDKKGVERIISTVPGQGYRFVGELIPVFQADDAQPAPPDEVLPADPQAPPGRQRRPSLLIGIAAVPLLALLVWGVALRLHVDGAAGSDSLPILSIVVMPFRNLSADRSLDHLVDGISDDLTTDLSHIPGSVVIARATSDMYKNRPEPASQIGRELHVRFLLEGSVRADEDEFRVNAQLIDTKTDGHLWADRFTIQRSEAADPQSRIVQLLSSALAAELIEVVAPSLEHDTRPLALFYRARYAVMHDYPLETLEGQTKAQNLLEQAVAEQPDFADALADLGWLLLIKRTDLADPDGGADLARARQVIGRALELAPKNPKALAALGWLQTSDGNCQQAAATYQEALTVDQNSVPALAGIAVCYLWQGRAREAIDALDKVMRMDPAGPGVKYRYIQLGIAYFMLEEYRPAIGEFLQAIAGEPDTPPKGGDFGRLQVAHSYLIAGHDLVGERERAREEYAEYNRIWPHQTVWHLQAFNTKAQSAMAGIIAYGEGLRDAGMPYFADEYADYGIAPSGVPHGGGAFDPTPLRVPGVPTIDTKQLLAMLHGADPPVIVDDWPESSAVLPGTLPIKPADLSDGELRDRIGLARKDRPGAPVVVTSVSSLGWGGYDSTLKLKAAGIGNLLWYRGGQEAWAAHGQKGEDRRLQ